MPAILSSQKKIWKISDGEGDASAVRLPVFHDRESEACHVVAEVFLERKYGSHGG
jgi:hypothetical protein